MKSKKIRFLFCAAALTLSLAACGSKTSDCSGQTITGEITDIDGTAVTMQLGELSAGGMPSHDVSDSSDSGQTPPDKPDGETQSGNSSSEDHASSDSSQPPAKPDSQSGSTDSQPPEMPSGSAPGGMGGSSFTAGEESVTLDFVNAEITKNDESIELSDLAEGDILTVEVGSSNTAASATVESVGGGQSFGGSGEVTQGTAATTISEDGTYSGESYTSTGDDENALRVDGAAVTLDGVTVDKSAGAASNTEDGDFYGMNAALLAMNGATVTIKNATVTSSAQNGNGVFSYGGGTTSASNLVVETSGNSSTAIRSDRGGGTVNVRGGAYTSNGYNSPAVYSTADITVKNANLTANNSEALVIEGKNSITLEDCYVTGNMSDTKGTSSSENVHNVMIYQSMSGDADVGTSVFSMTGGSLVGSSGDMFYITNTHCLMTLSGVNIVNNDADGALLRVVGNSASRGWGTAGNNGTINFNGYTITLADGTVLK